jgi:hypothetical protein
MTKLDVLQVNKTVVFSSPLEKVLVRTGTIDDDSFFHAVLHACLNNYKLINTEGRTKLINELRSYVVNKLYKSKPYNRFVEETIIMLLSDFYNFISDGKSNTNKKIIKKVIGKDELNIETYKFITGMISIEELKNNILPLACNNISHYKNMIKKSVIDFKENSNEDKKNFYTEKLKILIKSVLKESYKYVSKNFKIDIDSNTITLISDKFDRDIYFIDSKTRMPCKSMCKSTNIKKRKSIILMLNENGTYDIVGKLLTNNRVKREFGHEDPIINKIYSYYQE